MGMACSLHRATAAEIEQLIMEPEGLNRFLGFDDGPPVREVRQKGLLGLLLRLTPVKITEVDPDAPERKAHVANPDRSIDIDKAWHGLHFLFTGTADEGKEPACYLVRGGEDLDDDGSGRALRPDQVRRFAEYLSALTPGELGRRYDPARMTKVEIYPEAMWSRRSSREDNPREWLLNSFRQVQAFVNRAAAAGDGIIIHLA